MTDLPDISNKLTKIEKKIIELRKKGKSFFELDESETRLATDMIMIDGSSLYGCPLVFSELLASAISRQIENYINDNYPEISDDEIIFALQINMQSDIRFPSGELIPVVEFYGSQFNVSFLVKVIEKYMRIRNILDRKLQNLIDGYPL